MYMHACGSTWRKKCYNVGGACGSNLYTGCVRVRGPGLPACMAPLSANSLLLATRHPAIKVSPDDDEV